MTYEELETLDGATPSTDDTESEQFAALCQRLAAARAAEAAANQARVEAEQALLAFIPRKDEGSITVKRAHWSITVTYPVNRTIDGAALESVRAALDPAVFAQAVTYKPSLSLPGLRSLQTSNPSAYVLLSEAITARPGKPSVKLEPNKEP